MPRTRDSVPGKKCEEICDTLIHLKKKVPGNFWFSNASQEKKCQETAILQSVSSKEEPRKKLWFSNPCEENFRCSNPYRARNSSNKDDASRTKSWMRETERQRQGQREKQSKRESESQVKRGRPNTSLLPFPVCRSPKKKKNQFVGTNLCGTCSGRSVCEWERFWNHDLWRWWWPLGASEWRWQEWFNNPWWPAVVAVAAADVWWNAQEEAPLTLPHVLRYSLGGCCCRECLFREFVPWRPLKNAMRRRRRRRVSLRRR